MMSFKSWIGIAAWLLFSSTGSHANVALEQAIHLFETERYAASQELLEDILATHPDNATAHYYLGRLHFKREAYDQAIKHCKQAVDIKAKTAEHHFCLGLSYGKQAQQSPPWKQALLAPRIRRALEKTVELDPEHVPARVGLTHFYLRAPGFLGGSLDKAYTQALALLELDPQQGRELLARIQAKRDDVAATN